MSKRRFIALGMGSSMTFRTTSWRVDSLPGISANSCILLSIIYLSVIFSFNRNISEPLELGAKGTLAPLSLPYVNRLVATRFASPEAVFNSSPTDLARLGPRTTPKAVHVSHSEVRDRTVHRTLWIPEAATGMYCVPSACLLHQNIYPSLTVPSNIQRCPGKPLGPRWT